MGEKVVQISFLLFKLSKVVSFTLKFE